MCVWLEAFETSRPMLIGLDRCCCNISIVVSLEGWHVVAQYRKQFREDIVFLELFAASRRLWTETEKAHHVRAHAFGHVNGEKCSAPD
jgi:hypothetical protein